MKFCRQDLVLYVIKGEKGCLVSVVILVNVYITKSNFYI